MLNYYYDPILGLQYTYLGGFISIDIASIPELPTDLVLEMFMKQGLQFLESTNTPAFEIVGKITDYQL